MRILFLVHRNDYPFRAFIKPNAPGFVTSGKILVDESISYLSELDSLCEAHKCDAVVTTDFKVLKVLFPEKKFKDPDTSGQGLSVLDFQGNTAYTKKGRKILILAPLRHLVTSPKAPYLFKRFLGKLSKDSKFPKLPPLNSSNLIYVDSKDKADACLEDLSKEPLIAFDIETSSRQRITHISFSSIHKTYSFTITDLLDLECIRKILMTDALKIAQNGKYDCLHLLHWNCPIKNYYFDTYGLMQCWLAELPRSLDFIGSFFLDDILYWKDEDESDKALYNAKDTWVTMQAFLAWMEEAPQWAKDNYAAKFPVFFPHLSSEFEGIKVDQNILAELTTEHRKAVEDNLFSLNKCLGTKTFNPGSPKQVVNLLQLLSPKAKIGGSSIDELQKSALRHPLNAHLIDKIIAYRTSSKLFSTYLDATLWKGRVTYSLNAFGTETGRSSCSTSSFGEPPSGSSKGWTHYGVQVQNIPPEFKKCLTADEGFLLVEMDKAQAESRCTAYLAQEPKLIKAVEESPDFHSSNASAFFGIPFEDLWDLEKGKTKNKAIRDLAKRVNHGANYNMGENVLIQTMGESNLWKAKSLLNLPAKFDLKDIAKHLLDSFDKTYPRLRDKVDGWYGELMAEWRLSNGLIKTPDGWTRKFFGNPIDNKSSLNELVAHSPQHLNVALVDRGYFKIWYELEDPKKFRIKGQVHDSVFFQVHKDHLHLIDKAKEIFDATASITIHGRTMFIPCDVSGPKSHWK